MVLSNKVAPFGIGRLKVVAELNEFDISVRPKGTPIGIIILSD